MEHLQNPGHQPAAGSGSAPSACRAMPAARRSKARWRSATGISTPPKCMATRRPSAPRIAASGVARKDLHVTTKVWNENLAPDAIRRAFDASLKKLRLDHVDLYLVHWPAQNMNLPAIFETLMKLKEEGRTRAIGVANFNIALLKTVVEEIKAPIACNQVEYHVMLDQTPAAQISRCANRFRWSPIARWRRAARLPTRRSTAIGRKHGASAAQVALKWLLDQDGVAAIPKASRAESQQANLDALKVDARRRGQDRPSRRCRRTSRESRLLRRRGISDLLPSPCGSFPETSEARS